MSCFKCKMNEIVNMFLFVSDKFVPEMHLKQPDFTYSACGPFTKNKGRLEMQISFTKKNLTNLFLA